MKKYNEIYNDVEKRLSEYRFHHSKCVADRCVELAQNNSVDIEIAKMIGIVHDIAKEISKEDKIKYCLENCIEIDEIEMENPGLLHGKIGADIAKKEYDFSDEMCNAIKCHSTGKADMSVLDKILFIADMTSVDRTNFPDREYMIGLAEKSLDECCLHILDYIIKERIDERKQIHTDSIYAFNSLLKNNFKKI